MAVTLLSDSCMSNAYIKLLTDVADLNPDQPSADWPHQRGYEGRLVFGQCTDQGAQPG